MGPKSWSLLLGLVFFGAQGLIGGNTQTFPADNCSVTLPDSWQRIANPNHQTRIATTSPDGSQGVSLAIEPAPEGLHSVSEEFAEHIKQKVAAGQAEFLSERWFEVEGLSALEIKFRPTQLQAPNAALMQFFIGDDVLYQFTAFGITGDKEGDAVVQNCLASFRFLQTPVAPPTRYQKRQFAFNLGYTLGPILFLMAFVGALVWISYRALRPKRGHRRSRRRS